MTMITRGVPYPLGATAYKDGIQFAYVSKETDCGVVFFDKTTLQEVNRVAFPENCLTGDVHSMYIAEASLQDMAYCFYEKDTCVTDERAKAFAGQILLEEKKKIRPAVFITQVYDWENDRMPSIPYPQSIGYCMHVKGFSAHVSSKVKARGTYGGIIEKIPYLKELGITTLELQPAYEFDENEGEKINYWGYKTGYYYVPKASYARKNPVTEFKDMVKALHQNGLEVIMQFYFGPETSKHEIAEILAYWTAEYHVDGFHLKGANIDAGMLMTEPALSRIKLWYYGFPIEQTVAEQDKRLASYTEYYRYDMRRFLKGDEGMISALMYHLRHNPAEVGQINYLSNYDGFTMMDMVSYNKKHNEANGEDNRDGTDNNASWNCGKEGASRKKDIQALRKKQIKNAWLLLFLSQSTPLIFMGDEFGNSQGGNNNPYCQDNEVTWLNWKNKEKETGKEIFEFAKKVIALRKEHPVFRQEEELRRRDYIACGYPDVSYHGKEAWQPDASIESRQMGVLYCGEYAKKTSKQTDDYFYIAYNMHWEAKEFALPFLPKGLRWERELLSDGMEQKELQTGISSGREAEEHKLSDKERIILPGRTIGVYKSTGERKQGAHESRTAF